MYSVIQKISFCYAHRLINYQGKCRNLHGHNAKVEIQLSADLLDDKGMVIDFFDIKRIAKTWIDATLDHKLLLHKDDSLVDVLTALNEPFNIFETNPTAEALAQYIFVQLSLLGLPITKITFFETDDCAAVYQAVSANL